MANNTKDWRIAMASLGIDFGTTNSVMVSYDKKRNSFDYFCFKDLDNPSPISSTVWYHDDKITVGKIARDNLHKFVDVAGNHFEKSIKLKLGTDEIRKIFGKKVLPYEIASDIIEHLKSVAVNEYDADKVVDDMRRAVFTIPIKFSGSARKDLRKAANDAGIEVTTFIHEPFAAIVGYYFTKEERDLDSILLDLIELDGKHVLTFDWGGGTLDITVVKIDGGKMQEIGTAELTGKAGDKFDEEIANLVWDRYLNKIPKGKYTESYLDAQKKRKWGKLLAIAEQSKIALSVEDSTVIWIEDIIDDEDELYEEVTREDFSKLIGNIIDEACAKIDSALRIAGISDGTISRVLLTGGSSCIPAVQDRLRERFGHKVETIKNADMVIAQGAAVISEMKWLPFLTKDIQVELCDDSYYALFEGGEPIAADGDKIKEQTFTCVDQKNECAKLIICEGVRQEKNKVLAIINVPVRKDPRFGDEIQVNARMDNNIILHVSAYSLMANDKSSNRNNAIRKTAEISEMCFGLEIRE